MIFPWDKAEQYNLPPLKVVLCALKKLSKATGVQVKPGAARDSAECEGKQKQRENDEVRGEWRPYFSFSIDFQLLLLVDKKSLLIWQIAIFFSQ